MFSKKQDYPGRSGTSSRRPALLSNEYFQVVLTSFIMGILMTLSVFGLYGMIVRNEFPVPHYSYMLLLFAVVFIFFFVFFDRRQMVNKVGTVGLGFVAASCVTIILMTILECLILFWKGAFPEIGVSLEIAVTVLAVAMIVSALLIKTVSGAMDKL